MEHKKKGGQFHAICALTFLSISSLICFVPVLFIGLLKLMPIKKWQAYCTKSIDAVVMLWNGFNNFYLKRMPVQWDISGMECLHRKHWYIVVANHQSWLDIVILQRLFNRKIPVLKFFIKDQLKWLPFFGFAWWAMGCPFMKRYSKKYLAKKPHKKGKDLTATMKAVEKFKMTPASVMNFVEGTRFSKSKQQEQNSPYQNLLRPRAGGLSFVISTMGQQISSLIDVTIIYPNNHFSLWDFLCRRIRFVKVHIRQLTVPQEFKDQVLINDDKVQTDFRAWLNQQWAEKDRLISTFKNEGITP